MPLVAFSLQAGLMQGGTFEDSRMPLAFCALGLGVLYAGLSWLLRRRENYDVLAQSYALLAVGFATLAVPLALSAQATASVFALEGAALVWLGLRQSRLLPQLTGAGLQMAAAFAFFIARADAWSSGGFDATAHPMFANAPFMSALLSALAGLANRTLICCLPGSTGACQLGWEQLIRDQLDARTRPCNFVAHLSTSAIPA